MKLSCKLPKTTSQEEQKSVLEWLTEIEELLGQEMEERGILLPFHTKVQNLRDVIFTDTMEEIQALPRPQKLIFNSNKGSVQIALQDKNKRGLKVDLTPDMAQTIAAHLLRMAGELEGVKR